VKLSLFKALLWDVDGTLAETERDGHLVAFNRAFDALGIPWRWSEQHYGALLHVSGGRERLLHDMQFRAFAPAEDVESLVDRLHRLKNEFYANIVATGEVALREGVRELLADCEAAGIRMGIATTTSRSNVEALLDVQLGADWESKFAAVVCAREAPKKKPDPQVYQLALRILELPAHEVVAIEDAPAGIAAARAAGVPVLVTRSHFFAAVDTRGSLAAGPSLGRSDGWHPRTDSRVPRIDLGQIARWYAQRRRTAGIDR
jgi:HAD superfamily hydrolase (TIGR01509 family)